MTHLQRAGLCLLFLCLAAMAQDENKAPTATLNLTVVKEANGKPVKNAEVVLHLLDKHGNQKQDGLELKTHEDGKAATSGIPYGKVRIQVIARGFRTWGDDVEVTGPNMELTIKLQKPKEQFSIYK
jgi:Carboxypeptidase regulatory-like domain